jgi:hypothetical protein
MEDIDFTMLKPCVDATIAAVRAYKDYQLEEANATIILCSDLKDYNIHTSEAQRSDFQKRIQDKYLSALVEQLKDRLPDVVGSIFHLRSFTSTRVRRMLCHLWK